MQEVAVVEGLQAKVGELQIPLRLQGRAQGIEIEAEQVSSQQLQFDPALDEASERTRVGLGHL